MKTLFKFGALVPAICLVAGCSMRTIGPELGHFAPDFEVLPFDTAAPKQSTQSLRGRPVLLDFWSTTCGYCRRAKPEVNEMAERFGPEGLVVLEVTNETRSKVERWAESMKKSKMKADTGRIYLDTMGTATSTLRVQGNPTFVLISPEGRIVARISGYKPNLLAATVADYMKTRP